MLSLDEIVRLMAGPTPPGVDSEAYSVLRAIWHTYPRAATAARAVIPPDQPTRERWAGLRGGDALLDAAVILWDAPALRQQVRRLVRVLGSPSLPRLDELPELREVVTRDGGEPIRWARLFLEADAADPRPELLLGGYVIQPFLYAYARRVLPRLRREGRSSCRCPVCGGRPYHGYLDPESRQKVLVCGRCLCPFPAPRLQCPFCQNARPELLGYCYEEPAARRRVDYCTACRSVLAITLQPESSRRFPLHDHLASMPLLATIERSFHDDQPP